MYMLESALLALAIVIRGAAAQCTVETQVSSLVSALSKLGADSNSVAADVNGFEASDGLLGALAIQNGYNTISSDVVTANSFASALASGLPSCNQDAVVTQLNSMAPNVVALLQALVAKNTAFSSVGADGIVYADLTNLEPQVHTLENGAYSKLECSAIQAIYGGIVSINDNFGSALAAYGATASAAPTTPASCACMFLALFGRKFFCRGTNFSVIQL